MLQPTGPVYRQHACPAFQKLEESGYKGRDWFDFEWYVRNDTPMNLSHFVIRARQNGSLHEEHLSEPDFRQLLDVKRQRMTFQDL